MMDTPAIPKIEIASDLLSNAMQLKAVENASIELVEKHIDLTNRLRIYFRKKIRQAGNSKITKLNLIFCRDCRNNLRKFA
jgi:hypothetical protein